MKMDNRKPWTPAELKALLPTIEARLQATEEAYPDVRPVSPLTEDETRELLNNLFELATTRMLSKTETFLGGQLLAQYKQAIWAHMLGKKGRYYVISEEDLAREKARGENVGPDTPVVPPPNTEEPR